jgi:hypothetical protein
MSDREQINQAEREAIGDYLRRRREQTTAALGAITPDNDDDAKDAKEQKP